jgi:hypothetical protein
VAGGALADILRGVLTHPSIRTGEEAFGLLKLSWPHAGGLIRRVNTRDSEQNLSEFRHPRDTDARPVRGIAAKLPAH